MGVNKRKLLKKVFAVSAGLGAFLVGATMTLYEYGPIINNALQIQTSQIVPGDSTEEVDTAYYKSDYADANLLAMNVDQLTEEQAAAVSSGLAELNADQDAFIEYEMENSAVLLKNNGALPLGAGERSVSLFGFASKQPLYSCASGGGKNDAARVTNYIDAFRAKGFTVNQTLYDRYPDPDFVQSFGGMIEKRLDDEPDLSTIFTADVDASVRSTGGVGIVILSREGGEGEDIPKFVTEGDGTVRSGLALSNNEKNLLARVKNYKDTGAISKIIVLHNSPYAMELGWLDEYGVDAALHVGTLGLKGTLGVVDLLTGAANPSGRLVDTFAENSLSSAAVQTWYDQAFTNTTYQDDVAYVAGQPVSNAGAEKYMVLTEGIYTGYKYYETRYEDAVLNRYNATSTVGSTSGAWNYANEMVYPFGYGLSYTTFSQTLDSVTGFNSDTITVKVNVRNTGATPGRSVVQVYAQTPYGAYEQEHDVEKSAVQLVGFGKTGELASGASETVTIEIDKYLLASWDSTSNGGEGGYILSEGDYYIAIGDNVHDALNNILAAKGAEGMTDENGNSVAGDAEKAERFTGGFDDSTYRYSDATGYRVKNQFEDVDINYWLDDADKVTYMTRSNWETFPTAVPQIEATEAMAELLSYTYEKAADAPGYDASEFGVDAGLKVVDMREVPWEDEITWDKFLHQMTLEELGVSIADSFGNAMVESIGKPASVNDDGPDGWNQKYVINGAQATCYIGQATAACSFDTAQLDQRAYYMAEDGLFCKASQGWLPGGNLHRTPFSGRNHEYFSEDANVNYLYLDGMVRTFIDKGISVGGKHFAGNDVELNRSNISMFQTEQTWRQNSLRGFESSFTKGGATSTMNCKGGIGLRNMSEDYASQVEVLRNEWGFKGVVIADAGSGRGVEGILSGTDMWCLFGSRYSGEIIDSIEQNNDGDLLDAVLTANKRYYYAFSRSIMVNGLSSDSDIIQLTPWWQPTIIAIDCVVGAVVLGSLAGYIVCSLSKKKEEQE